MALYNVAVAVVELVEATDEKAAIQSLVKRLTRDGYDVYDGEVNSPDAFKSEVQ